MRHAQRSSLYAPLTIKNQLASTTPAGRMHCACRLWPGGGHAGLPSAHSIFIFVKGKLRMTLLRRFHVGLLAAAVVGLAACNTASAWNGFGNRSGLFSRGGGCCVQTTHRSHCGPTYSYDRCGNTGTMHHSNSYYASSSDCGCSGTTSGTVYDGQPIHGSNYSSGYSNGYSNSAPTPPQQPTNASGNNARSSDRGSDVPPPPPINDRSPSDSPMRDAQGGNNAGGPNSGSGQNPGGGEEL